MEATVVLVDNSEMTRNGDYAPTRFQAQADAVNLLAGAKTQHHPENTVGVLTMAGKTPQVLVTPTPDLGKVLNAMQDMKIEGDVNLATSVQIAQLALKHRQNKNQRQRIVIFVGSPIAEDKDALVKIAKKLKKNNVAVDVVSFGSEEANSDRLEAFHAAVNSNDNSHLVTVPPGTILSDMLFGTPIFMEEGAGGGGGGGEEGGAPAPRSNVVDGFDYGELGVDPTLDPELALALRVSMEEERARQAAATAAADQQGGGEATPAAGAAAVEAATPVAAAGGGEAEGMAIDAMDDDMLLQQALALSMQVEQEEMQEGGAAETPEPQQPPKDEEAK
ncbi:26S proteasome non-ATPase regulatory subunit 4 [Chlorella vulgaris]